MESFRTSCQRNPVVWTLGPGFCHSFGPSMLYEVAFPSFSCHQLHNYITDYLASLLLMDIWLISNFWLLSSMLLWTFFCMAFGDDMDVFLLSTCLGGESRGQKLRIRSAFVHSAKDTTSSRVRAFQLLRILNNLWDCLGHYKGQRVSEGKSVSYSIFSCALSRTAM